MGGDVDAPAHAPIICLRSRHCAPLLLVTLLNGHHSLQRKVNRSDFDAHTTRILPVATRSDTFDARARNSPSAARLKRNRHSASRATRDGATLLKVHTAFSSFFGPEQPPASTPAGRRPQPYPACTRRSRESLRSDQLHQPPGPPPHETSRELSPGHAERFLPLIARTGVAAAAPRATRASVMWSPSSVTRAATATVA